MICESKSSITQYMKMIKRYNVLTPEEETKIIEMIVRNDNETERAKAKETLINSNLKLVIKIAHDFKGMGVSFEDLISVGNIGLIKAVDNFKDNKGAKFSTYASLWIRAYIKRELDKMSRTVTFSADALNKMRKLEKSVSDVIEGVNNENKKKIYAIINGYSEFSLNEKVDDENAHEKGDLIEDENSDTYGQVEGNDLIDFINKKADEILTDKEKYVLFSRYGINGFRFKTQRDIAKDLKLTHQRVEQIEKDALSKIKCAMLECKAELM